MKPATINKNKGQRQVLTLLILVFLMPFVAAWLIYNFTDVGQGGNGGNYGELIVPPLSIPDSKLLDPLTGLSSNNLGGMWNLLYVMAAECAVECSHDLDMLLGIRTALLKDAGRLQIIAAGPDTGSEKGLREYLEKDQAKRILFFPHLISPGTEAQGTSAVMKGVFEPGKFYIIDPLGNLIMRYSANSDPEGLISDLKRLLRYSRIG